MSPRQRRRKERNEAMLDAALDILRRDAAVGLVSLLSIEKVAREAGVPATARRDWEGTRGVGLLAALVEQRLNLIEQDGVGELAETVFTDYPSTNDANFASWFVESMTAYQNAALHRSTTIPGLLVTAAAATGTEFGEASHPANPIATQLADSRRQYYETLTAGYQGLLEQLLADMGRRPVAGMDSVTMIHLIQAIHEGAILRRHIDPDVFGQDGHLVAQTQLAIVETFSEPIAHTADRIDDPVGWVAETAPAAALACAANPISLAAVVDELSLRSGGVLPVDETEALLRRTYSTDTELWDVTLRWRLATVAATLQVRGIRSDGAILQLVLRRIYDVCETHPGLATAICDGGLATEGAYVSSLVSAVEDLLDSLGAPDPTLLAPRLVELALEGHYQVVSSLLGAINLLEPADGKP